MLVLVPKVGPLLQEMFSSASREEKREGITQHLKSKLTRDELAGVAGAYWGRLLHFGVLGSCATPYACDPSFVDSC